MVSSNPFPSLYTIKKEGPGAPFTPSFPPDNTQPLQGPSTAFIAPQSDSVAISSAPQEPVTICPPPDRGTARLSNLIQLAKSIQPAQMNQIIELARLNVVSQLTRFAQTSSPERISALQSLFKSADIGKLSSAENVGGNPFTKADNLLAENLPSQLPSSFSGSQPLVLPPADFPLNQMNSPEQSPALINAKKSLEDAYSQAVNAQQTAEAAKSTYLGIAQNINQSGLQGQTPLLGQLPANPVQFPVSNQQGLNPDVFNVPPSAAQGTALNTPPGQQGLIGMPSGNPDQLAQNLPGQNPEAMQLPPGAPGAPQLLPGNQPLPSAEGQQELPPSQQMPPEALPPEQQPSVEPEAQLPPPAISGPPDLSGLPPEAIEQMLTQPASLDDQVNAMLEVGKRNLTTPKIVQTLESLALTDTSGITDEAQKKNALKVQQAAIWTMGWLDSQQPPEKPTKQLPGMIVFKKIAKDKTASPIVQMAVLEALNLSGRNDNYVKGIFKKAANSKDPALSEYAKQGPNPSPPANMAGPANEGAPAEGALPPDQSQQQPPTADLSVAPAGQPGPTGSDATAQQPSDLPGGGPQAGAPGSDPLASMTPEQQQAMIAQLAAALTPPPGSNGQPQAPQGMPPAQQQAAWR